MDIRKVGEFVKSGPETRVLLLLLSNVLLSTDLALTLILLPCRRSNIAYQPGVLCQMALVISIACKENTMPRQSPHPADSSPA